jgi:uncharacterized membrane protein YciS (DUF1049 family)
MKGFFLRTWLWIKATLLAAVLLYLLLFIFNNNRRVEVWIWFGPKTEVSLLGLISTLLATGVVLTLLIKTVFTTIRQLQQARAKARTNRLEREVAEMRAKAEMLQKRERDSSPFDAPTSAPASSTTEASTDI